jgi:hypothetical protein
VDRAAGLSIADALQTSSAILVFSHSLGQLRTTATGGFQGRVGVQCMSDDEFQEFFDASVAELGQKQDELLMHGIGEFERWDFDQRDGKLRFSSGAGATGVVADVVIIGSYSAKSQTWKWAWANESLLPAIREAATVFRGLGAITGLDVFEDGDAVEIDADLAWQTVAMCVKHVGAIGAYRGPSQNGTLSTMFAITQISPKLAA